MPNEIFCLLQTSYNEQEYQGLDGDPTRDGAGSKISRTTTLEFQDFSRTYAFFPGNFNILISQLLRVCTNPVQTLIMVG